MADRIHTVSSEKALEMGPHRLEQLPYGMLEIVPNGTILEYYPFLSQVSPVESPRIRGLNLFEDFLPNTLLEPLRQVLPGLTANAGGSERLLLVFPFAERAIRLSVVATKIVNSPRVRISLLRAPANAHPAGLRPTQNHHKDRTVA